MNLMRREEIRQDRVGRVWDMLSHDRDIAKPTYYVTSGHVLVTFAFLTTPSQAHWAQDASLR